MTAPWWCLVAGASFALFSLNAIRPVRSRSPLSIPSFMAGWIATELPGGMLAAEIVVFIALVATGALGAWPGLVGAVLWVASFGTLVLLERRTRARAPWSRPHCGTSPTRPRRPQAHSSRTRCNAASGTPRAMVGATCSMSTDLPEPGREHRSSCSCQAVPG